MKVLFLANIPSPYRVNFFNELGKHCDLTVLYERSYASNREWKAEVEQYYQAIVLSGIPVGADTALCLSVTNYLKKDYDVIVVGGYSTPTGMLAIEYLSFHKIRFYLSCDGGFLRSENKLHYFIKQHFISKANAWLSTGATTNHYLLHYGARHDQIYEYPFTSVYKDEIKTGLTDEEKKKHKDTLHIPYDKMIVTVGQFIHRKGNDVLIKAAAHLDRNVGVYIIGGEPTDEYIALKKQYKADHVHFVGFQHKESLSKYYMAADLFVLPTREDIWGLVVNEAMAHGLPIITTDKCVAGLELVKDDVNGFVIPSEDYEKLAESIVQILSDDHKRNMMGKNSLKIIIAYTIEKMAEVHQKYFEQMKL